MRGALLFLLLFSFCEAEYCVVPLKEGDRLVMREAPSPHAARTGTLESDRCEIYVVDMALYKKTPWYAIAFDSDRIDESGKTIHSGYPLSWVNGRYLRRVTARYATASEAFGEPGANSLLPAKEEKLSRENLRDMPKTVCAKANVKRRYRFLRSIRTLLYERYETTPEGALRTDTITFEIEPLAPNRLRYRRKSLASRIASKWKRLDLATPFSPLFPDSRSCSRLESGIYESMSSVPYGNFLTDTLIGERSTQRMIAILPAIAAAVDTTEKGRGVRYLLREIRYDTAYFRLDWNPEKIKEILTYEPIWHYRIYDKRDKTLCDRFYRFDLADTSDYRISWFDPISGEKKSAVRPLLEHNPLFPAPEGALVFEGRFETPNARYQRKKTPYPSVSRYTDAKGRVYDFLDGYEGVVVRYEDARTIFRLEGLEAFEKLPRFFDPERIGPIPPPDKPSR